MKVQIYRNNHLDVVNIYCSSKALKLALYDFDTFILQDSLNLGYLWKWFLFLKIYSIIYKLK